VHIQYVDGHVNRGMRGMVRCPSHGSHWLDCTTHASNPPCSCVLVFGVSLWPSAVVQVVGWGGTATASAVLSVLYL
jgi:hypothetical protein